jgi:hypothetical protein|tara:strand:+ start:16959 stop:17636 length:678 start_codon:yes stop_codon:yes gene_type:complete
MFDAYIITTINTFGTDKIKKLTQRAYDTCKANNVNPILFDAITPYTLEEYYPMWEVREDYRERLLGNYRRKAGKEPTKEIENRMIVMQQCMTMSHYQVRKKIIDKGHTAIVLEHDAIVGRPLDLNQPYTSRVVNLCAREQATHGYTCNPTYALKYNAIYDKIGFAGHDNMNRYINSYEEIKITPYKTGNAVVGGNALDESQWDTHRGALKTELGYIPKTTSGVYF